MEPSSLYNFKKHVMDMRHNPDKKKILVQYEKAAGKLGDDIEKTFFYQEHLSHLHLDRLYGLGEVRFPSFLTADPAEGGSDRGEKTQGTFIRDLLLRLIFCSLSCDYTLEDSESGIRIEIIAESKGKSRKNYLDDLLEIQVTSVIRILTEEQISHTVSRIDEKVDLEFRKSFNKRLAEFCSKVDELERSRYSRKKEQTSACPRATPATADEWADVDIRGYLKGWTASETDDYDPVGVMERLSTTLRRWMLTDIFLPFPDLKRTVSALLKHPSDEKMAVRILMLQSAAHKDLLRQDGEAAPKLELLRRTREWADTFGPIPFADADSLARCWGVGLPYILLQEGVVDLRPDDIQAVVDEEILGPADFRRSLSFVFYRHLKGIQESAISPTYIFGNLGGLGNADASEAVDLPEDPATLLAARPNSTFRNNMLIYGTSGSGKTWSIRRMCERLGLPFIHIHDDALVQEGIVGTNPSDCFRDAYRKEDKALLPFLVVIHDESDKLKDNHYGKALLNEMLSHLDKPGEVRFKDSREDDGQVTLPTSRMCFFFTGVFEGLKKGGSSDSGGQRVSKEDFVSYGFSWELLGRIGRISHLPQPDAEAVLRYLSGPHSPIDRYAALVKESGGELVVTEGGKRALAEIVASGKTGYRMADSILDSIYQEFLFQSCNQSCQPLLVIDTASVAGK